MPAILRSKRVCHSLVDVACILDETVHDTQTANGKNDTRTMPPLRRGVHQSAAISRARGGVARMEGSSRCFEALTTHGGESGEEQIRYAVLVPTYLKHSLYYCELLDSIYRRTERSDPFLLVTVFSTAAEQHLILTSCDACAGRPDIVMRALVFDLPYERAPSHWNYQTAKKLWALAQIQAPRTLVLDSDFLIAGANRTSLPRAIDAYARVDYCLKTRVLWSQVVVRETNGLLGSDFGDFPLDPPWIYERAVVHGLLRHLARAPGLSNGSVVDTYDDMHVPRALVHHPKPLFEIVLYRFYARMVSTQNQSLCVRKRPPGADAYRRALGVILEAGLSEHQRAAYHLPGALATRLPPPATTRRDLQDGRCCSACWLLTYMDRANGLVADACLRAAGPAAGAFLARAVRRLAGIHGKSCPVSVREVHSRYYNCTPGTTFGCAVRPLVGPAVWVAGGCRGVFTCARQAAGGRAAPLRCGERGGAGGNTAQPTWCACSNAAASPRRNSSLLPTGRPRGVVSSS